MWMIEYYDIKDIPINRAFFVAVVINEGYMEIYTNGKLLKVNHTDPLANLYYLSNFIFIEKDFYKNNSSIIHS